MKAVFENATIADAINKAARVAPTRGSAFDKAAGIILSLNEEAGNVTVMATNLEVYYMEVVDALEVEGTGWWRFPSSIISGVLSKLPIGSNRSVALTGDSREVNLKSGRTTAKMRVIQSYDYPIWEPFDPDMLDIVPDLGARIEQIEWAAETDPNSPIAGVHLDGSSVIATDRIRMATAPCEAEPITHPVTIPAGVLKPVMRTMRDCAIGILDGQFLIMPDPNTQIRTVIYAGEYPNVKRAMARDQTGSFTFRKSELIEMIDRASVFSGSDRTPSLQLIVGRGEVAVMMSDQDQGFLGDVMEVTGADHKRLTMLFTPKNLLDPLNAAPSDQVTLHYYPDSEKPKLVRIDGGSGYEAWIMPRGKVEQSG